MTDNDTTRVRKPNTTYGLVSRYRGELMGFAALWVVLFHSFIRLPDWLPGWLYEPLNLFQTFGYGGVDIFLFVSGIGIYQSLSKNDPGQYFKNRLSRIYPIWGTYVVMMLAVFALGYHQYFSIKEIFGYLTFFGNWSSELLYQGNWYVYTIMLFYVLAPIPFFLLRSSKRKMITGAILVTVALLGSTAFISADWFLQKHYLIAFSRLPVFFVGMVFSAALKEKVMRARDLILCAAVFCVGAAVMIYLLKCQPKLLWPYGMWWYPFLLIAPTGSLLLCKLFCLCEKGLRRWHAVLRFLGKASLEIFLISNFLFARIKNAVDITTLRVWQSVLIALGGIAAGIVFHLLVQLGVKGVSSVYRKCRKNQPAE